MNKTRNLLLAGLFLIIAGGAYFFLSKKYSPNYNPVPKCTIWFSPSEDAPFTITDEKAWKKFFSEISTCESEGLLVYSTTPTRIPDQPVVTPNWVHDLEIRFEYHPLENITKYEDGSFVNGSYFEIDTTKSAGVLYIHLTRETFGGLPVNELLLASFGVKVNEVLNNVYAGDYLNKPIANQLILLRTQPEMIGVTMK